MAWSMISLLLWSLVLPSFLINQALGDSLKQHPLLSQHGTKRIAIIGAGSGGASAAYYARKFADQTHHGRRIPLNITVYERSPYVGGRSTTVNVHDDPSLPVELGASIFVQVNRNLVAAVEELGLKTSSFSSKRSQEEPDVLGVWNGVKFVFTQSDRNPYWWNIAKLVWKYGYTPIRTNNLMKVIVDRFLKMYEPPHMPFRSLSRVAYDLDLVEATSSTGEQFLKAHKILPPFSTDIVQASTRVNYAQNLSHIHGLETMVCMATSGAMSVEGGNWQIFDGMIRAAGADMRLNTSVTRIHRGEDGLYDVHAQPSSESVEMSNAETSPEVEQYDHVILAAPFQFSDLAITPELSHVPDKIPYVRLHVTLFASPHRLSPGFFNLADSAQVPQVILTTLNGEEDVTHPSSLVFFSISVIRTIDSTTQTLTTGAPRREYVYKIFSPAPVTESFLARLLGISSSTYTRTGSQHADENGSISKKDITWRFTKIWDSYPYLYPRVTFEELELAPRLWYTSGMESFISTMETSSLMGMNVARLVVDDLLGVMGEDGDGVVGREEL